MCNDVCMDAQGASPPIGRIIKRAREKKRWSQQEAAAMLGVSRSALNAWENDRAYPRSSIGALEDLYGIVLDSEPPEPQAEPEPDPLAELLGEGNAEKLRRIARDRMGAEGERLIGLIEDGLGRQPPGGAPQSAPGARRAPR